jgi:ubiquitin fusion degradation protein 1
MFFNQGGPFRPQRNFTHTYYVTPLDNVRPDLRDSGKIILPPSALATIANLNIQYPMHFVLFNNLFREKKTHCGVLEFTAIEGRAYIPHWMMQNIKLDTDSRVQVSTIDLRSATYVKLQPQSVEFLNISNPKAVLEKKLRGYAALTKGDMILINYVNRDFYLEVLEIKPENPSHAVTIIEADVSVDFAPPVGYKEPEPVYNSTSSSTGHSNSFSGPRVFPKLKKSDVDPLEGDWSSSDELSDEEEDFAPFNGQGARINGKTVKVEETQKDVSEEQKKLVAVIGSDGNLVYKPRNQVNNTKEPEENDEDICKDEDESDQGGFKPFSGSGNKIR